MLHSTCKQKHSLRFSSSLYFGLTLLLSASLTFCFVVPAPCFFVILHYPMYSRPSHHAGVFEQHFYHSADGVEMTFAGEPYAYLVTVSPLPHSLFISRSLHIRFRWFPVVDGRFIHAPQSYYCPIFPPPVSFVSYMLVGVAVKLYSAQRPSSCTPLRTI